MKLKIRETVVNGWEWFLAIVFVVFFGGAIIFNLTMPIVVLYAVLCFFAFRKKESVGTG